MAWDSLTTNVPEIKKIIDTCSSISTHFHRSGLRTKELQQVADENNLTLIRLPKYFEVRWTEFTYSLIHSVLRNWRAMVIFFKKQVNEDKCKVSAGFLKFLTNYDNLKLLCFLTDLGYIFSRYQQLIQGDEVLIFDIQDQPEAFKSRMINLKLNMMTGGWENTFEILKTENKNVDEDIQCQIHGINLYKITSNNKRRKIHHLYVSDYRNFELIRNEAIESILYFMDKRLDSSEWNDVKPLKSIKIDITDAELEKCHKRVCPDYPLMDFIMSYREAASCLEVVGKNVSVELLKVIMNCPSWKPLTVAMVFFFFFFTLNLFNNN